MLYGEIKNLPNEDIALLVTADNHAGKYLCDCGYASGLTVKECQELSAVFISHTHVDHFINFDHILRNQLGVVKTVVLVGPKGFAQQVQSKARGYIWNLIKEGEPNISYEVREVEEDQISIFTMEPPFWELKPVGQQQGDVVYKNEKFQVRFTLLDHGIPTVAYKFEESSKVNINIGQSDIPPGPWINELKNAYSNNKDQAIIDIAGENHPASNLYHLLEETPGSTLGFIMDHHANDQNHQRILKLFKGADKVYIEAYYKTIDSDLANNNFHSVSHKSAEVMRLATVKEAIPVHFSRRYTDEDIKDLIAEFENAFRG